MSEENVKLVEAAYDVFATSGPEAFSDYWADDIEWEAIGGRFRGPDAGRAYMREWFDYFDDFTVETFEFIDAGNDRVVVWVRISGRARGGGIEPPPAYFAVALELRNGKIARAVEYPTRAEALEAVGLSE